MAGINVLVADTTAEAEREYTVIEQMSGHSDWPASVAATTR